MFTFHFWRVMMLFSLTMLRTMGRDQEKTIRAAMLRLGSHYERSVAIQFEKIKILLDCFVKGFGPAFAPSPSGRGLG
jgi:hypothetical protein